MTLHNQESVTSSFHSACTVKHDSIGASDQKMFSWHPWDFGVVFQVVGEP